MPIEPTDVVSGSFGAHGVESPHVSICVLTYKRVAMLAHCLESLLGQRAEGFTCSVLVVDNDASESARDTVQALARNSRIKVDYVMEPEQNIAMARNRAVACSVGDYIAFIDDDETCEPDWVATLLAGCRSLGVDGVLGPVVPKFEGTPPRWLIESGLCHRAEFPTGATLSSARYMRTGNVLFARAIVADTDAPFDAKFGRSGGEDTDFFGRMLQSGKTFAWVNEAIVQEWVPLERQTLRYHLRRGAIRGVGEAEITPVFDVGTLRSLAAIAVYAVMMPVQAVFSFPRFARSAVSCTDHLSKLLAHCGVRIARYR